MKKLFAAIVSAVLVAAMAVSLAACATGDPVKVIEIDLTQEEYAFILPKGSPIEDEINGYIAQLNSSEGLDGVTVDELFEAEANDNSENIVGCIAAKAMYGLVLVVIAHAGMDIVVIRI